ncbi:MAG: magnesium transporter CorA family protein [Anaerolineales bacterium]|nr:magnesium transporter CorA family protein [Anaerolineales bacterium]
MKFFKIIENRLLESDPASGQVVLAVAPDDNERANIKEEFRLDDYDMASTHDPDEVPRIETSNGRMLLIWKVPQSTTASEAVDCGVAVTGVRLVQNRVAFIRASGDIAFNDREFRAVQDVRDVLLAFLLKTVRHFVAHLRVIRTISRELENKITVSMENRHLLQMFSLGESLVYYLDAIEGNGAALAKLRSVASQQGFEPRHLEVLDDIILENKQAARQASIFSSVLSGLMDARGTIVNNNMNVLLKNLTLINIVFLPLNLVASIGGMSEWSMMTAGIDWRISYALFSFAMVVLGWGTWIFMRKVIERGVARRQGLPRNDPRDSA